MKKAAKMQFDAVEKAKMFRISLDEAKSEKDIKMASMRLAGAKSVETRAKKAMESGGVELQKLTAKEHDYLEAKHLSDATLQEAAKLMKKEQESDGKLAAQRKQDIKDAAEREKGAEGRGKEQVIKNDMKLKESESKMSAQKKAEEQEVKTQKAEVKKKVDGHLDEEYEKGSKHDGAKKEIWDKEKARRADRQQLEESREAKKKADAEVAAAAAA